MIDKKEKIKELEILLTKLQYGHDDLNKVTETLESGEKNTNPVKQSRKLGDVLDELVFLKYCSPNFKYFDLPLDEKIVDEHFKKVENARDHQLMNIWNDLFDYDYHMSEIYKLGIKQPGLFYYSDAFTEYHTELILILIKNVVKFRFVNGICNTLFYSRGAHPRSYSFDNEFFKLPLLHIKSSLFYQSYALPLYHLVPKQEIIKLHKNYNEGKKGSPYYRKAYHLGSFIKCEESLLGFEGNNVIVDYYSYNCRRIGNYLVNLSAKYFAYNIARLLVRNILFLPAQLSPGNKRALFWLNFPDTFNMDFTISAEIVKKTVKYLEQILNSNSVVGFKAGDISSRLNEANCNCSFSVYGSRAFEFNVSVSDIDYTKLNYPYRSFYIPDCKESDEDFYNKIHPIDKVNDLGFVNLQDKNGTYYYDFYRFCWPDHYKEEKKGGHYFLHMTKSEIDYYNLEVEQPFSHEIFKKQVEELRKKINYNDFYNYYSFLIADTAFYQFEKYLEYELEQFKKKNNVNYEHMLEERKEKENFYDFRNLSFKISPEHGTP